MKYLLIFIIFVFTMIIGMHFLKIFNIIEGLENEEVAIPDKEDAIPAEEVNIPAEEVNIPAEEVNIPAEEVNIPAEEVNIPAKEEVDIPAKEEVDMASNNTNSMQSKNEEKSINGHSLNTAPGTPYVTTTISVAPPVIQAQPKQNIPIMKFNQYKPEIPVKSQPANIKSNKTISNTDNSKNIERTPINKKSF